AGSGAGLDRTMAGRTPTRSARVKLSESRIWILLLLITRNRCACSAISSSSTAPGDEAGLLAVNCWSTGTGEPSDSEPSTQSIVGACRSGTLTPAWDIIRQPLSG